MMKRIIARLAATVALAIVGTGVTAAPPAEAQLSCPLGYACVYDVYGEVIYRNAGDTGDIEVGGSITGKVWNHGRAFPGADHIQLHTRYAGSAWTICLHYGNAQTLSQPDPTAAHLGPKEVVTGWTWRGECVGDEDIWRRV
jgi:hypothetical protein